MPHVHVIILNYNSAQTLNQCLASVFRSRNAHPHVIVVDNASTDESLDAARAQFPRVEYIKNKENVGFAAGNNMGIRFALEKGAKYIALINSDATIDPDMLAHLSAVAAQSARPAVLCPQIFTPNGNVWYAGASVNWATMRVQHQRKMIPQTKTFCATDILTGCVLFADKEVFARTGLLNESYFLYYEDADFSLTARHKDCRVGIVPSARATHREVSEHAAFKPMKTYWLVLSALIFCTAHAPLRYRILYTAVIPLRRLKARFAPTNKELAPHVRRAFKDFRAGRKHYVRHY